MNTVTIVNRTKNCVLGTRIEIADTFLTRLIGLVGRSGLEPDCGLLIEPSSGIHMFGMRFPIDVIALDRRYRVVRTWSRLRPWRTSSVNWRTHSVLELPAGCLTRFPAAAGDQLEIFS